MRIVLDAMGSDNHPQPELHAAEQAYELWGEVITLTGPETELRSQVDPSLVEIVNASEVIGMTDKPAEAARAKQASSMAVGMQLVKQANADAFVTVGNTGGAMATALFQLGRLKGVRRPALGQIFPVKDGTTVVIDVGANADCRPDYLLQFAVLGSIYAEIVLAREGPRVALLSTGEEQGKGNELVREADKLLQRARLNYVGNVEPKELYQGAVDVVVTDGFSGNIFLKTTEAVASLLSELLRSEIRGSPLSSVGGVLARPAFRRVGRILDPAEYGATPLLGVDGLVFIGHGRSNEHAIVNAIRVAREAVDRELMPALRAGFEAALSGG